MWDPHPRYFLSDGSRQKNYTPDPLSRRMLTNLGAPAPPSVPPSVRNGRLLGQELINYYMHGLGIADFFRTASIKYHGITQAEMIVADASMMFPIEIKVNPGKHPNISLQNGIGKVM